MQSASWWGEVRGATAEIGAAWGGAGRAAGKGPGLAAGGATDAWQTAADDVELARQQLAAARRGSLAELKAAAASADAERAAGAAGTLGWTLAAVRTRLRDAEERGAGAVDLVAEIERLREEERAMAREGEELRGQLDAAVARAQSQPWYGKYLPSSPVAAVREPDGEGVGATASEWIAHHAQTLEEAVANRLAAMPLAPGHARLRWSADGSRFLARVLSEVWHLAGDDPWSGVRRAVVPADLDDVVDGARVLEGGGGADRRARGPLTWFPEVAIAIARVLAGRVTDSLARLAPRYIAVADARAHASPDWPTGMRVPEVADLVPAHPIDPALIAALCDGLVDVGPGPAVVGFEDRPVELGAAGKLRRVQRYEWQNRQGAWSWLRVHEPADATLEEVAATLLGRPEAAYRMSASPPLFGFLPDDAARIPGARAALPLDDGAGYLAVMRPVEALTGGTVTAHPVDALAASELCDEAALAQAERAQVDAVSGQPGRDAAAEFFAAAAISLGFLALKLSRFGLSWRVREVRERTAARRTELAAVADAEVGRWCALASQQAAFLEDVAPELDSLVRIADSAGATPDPVLVELAADLAGAIAVSDLSDAAQARLEAARGRKCGAIADAFDHQLDRAMDELESVRVQAAFHGPDSRWVGKKVLVDDLRARDAELRAEVAHLRVELAQRRADPAAMDSLQRRVHAAQREAELVAAISHLNPMLATVADEEGAMAVLTWCEAELEDARQDLLALKSSFQFLYRQWNERQASLAARVDRLAPEEAAAEARSALAELDTGLRHLGTERLRAALQRAHDRVQDARKRKAIADFALMIGMPLASMGVGALFRGAALALRIGGFGVAAAETAGYTASMVTLRATIHDEPVVDALVSELCGLGGMAVASRAVRATGVAEMFAAGRSAGRLGRLASRGADVAVHAGGAAGGQLIGAEGESLIRRGELLAGDEALGVARDGAMIGAAHGIGRRFLDGYLDRMSQLGARGVDLVARGHRVRRAAAAIDRAGDPEAALFIAYMERDLAEAELLRLEAIARDPDALRAIGQLTHASLFAQAHAESLALSAQGTRGVHRHITPETARSPRAAYIARAAEAAGIPVTSRQASDGSFHHTIGEGELAVELIESRANPWDPLLAPEDVHFADLDAVMPGKAYRGTRQQIERAFVSLNKSGTPFEASFTAQPPKNPKSPDPKCGRWEVTIGLRRFQIDERLPDAAEADGWRAREDRPGGLGTGHEALARLLQADHPTADLSDIFFRAARLASTSLADIERNFDRASRPTRAAAAELAAAGVLPRILARVGAESDVRAHNTFVRPDRSFGFATDPSELVGLSPAEALYEVGWTREQIHKHIGKTIAVVAVDTRVPVVGADGGLAQMEAGTVRWPDLKRACIDDPAFVDAAARRGISRSKLADLFDIAARSPVKGLPATGDRRVANDVAVLYKLLAERKSTNELITGTGMTMREDGQLGAREVMVFPNGTGYRLTPDNHVIVTLGVLRRSDYEALFPDGSHHGAYDASTKELHDDNR